MAQVVSRAVDPAFWQGKRVFLTGHTGFKGSWLSIWLSSMGAIVRGYALEAPTDPALFVVARVDELVDSVIGDLRDRERLNDAMATFAPDIVIHMAAQPLVRASYDDPIGTYEINVMGTAYVLEAIRRSPSVRSAVIVTTDKCYENREWPWGYRENEAMGGHDPYSNSKGCAELVVSAYRRSFFHVDGAAGIASARAGNVIGGGDWALDRLLPDALRAFSTGRAVSIRNPNSIRPWQHVLEPLSGYLVLAQALSESAATFADGWNFGPRADDAWPVERIVGRIASLWGDATWTVDAGPHPHEAHYLQLDISKAKHILGWEPRWTLSETLTNTVRWHQMWIAGNDMQRYCIDEIDSFQRAG